MPCPRSVRHRVIVPVLLLCSLAAGTLVTHAWAKDKGQGQGQGQDNGKGSPSAASHPSHASGSDNVKPGHREKHDGRGDQRGAAARGDDYWHKDWEAADFLAAGFSAAVLRELLGDRTALLNTGAKPLPPGIAKNLARGKALPPGIARQHVGADLSGMLPRVAGHEWQRVGTDLVLIQAGSAIVAEIIRDVLR
ncbi:MAG: anti-virulence regulator CigR family protein [Gammaproteobacteria bacterium]